MFWFESLGSKVTKMEIEREKVKCLEGDGESDIQTQKAVEAQSWLRV